MNGNRHIPKSAMSHQGDLGDFAHFSVPPAIGTSTSSTLEEAALRVEATTGLGSAVVCFVLASDEINNELVIISPLVLLSDD